VIDWLPWWGYFSVCVFVAGHRCAQQHQSLSRPSQLLEAECYSYILSHTLKHMLKLCAYASSRADCTQKFARSSDFDHPDLDAV
jgi:hypothetical protein